MRQDAPATPSAPLVRMLLLTGQRKSEVAEARWREFDLDKKLWSIPIARMKGKAAHVVPLTDDVIAILRSLPRFARGDYLFSTRFGASPTNGFSKYKARLDRRMLLSWRALGRIAGVDRNTLKPYVLHDIRRTMRTHLSALPVPDLVRELVIGHTKPGLHKVYDQHAYLDEKRHALELWAKRLARSSNLRPTMRDAAGEAVSKIIRIDFTGLSLPKPSPAAVRRQFRYQVDTGLSAHPSKPRSKSRL